VYKPVVTYIDTDMGSLASQLIKKYQITSSKLFVGYPKRVLTLQACVTRYPDTGLLVAVLHQATAIKAFSGGVAAISVAYTDHMLGDLGNFMTNIGMAAMVATVVATRMLWCMTAGSKQGRKHHER
jgi:hypothetical protein